MVLLRYPPRGEDRAVIDALSSGSDFCCSARMLSDQAAPASVDHQNKRYLGPVRAPADDNLSRSGPLLSVCGLQKRPIKSHKTSRKQKLLEPQSWGLWDPNDRDMRRHNSQREPLAASGERAISDY